MEIITDKQLKQAYSAVEEARQDDAPFLSRNTKGEVSVVGDPNKTEVKPTSHIISYRFKKGELEEVPEGAEVIGDYLLVRVKYDNIKLDPKKDLLAVRSLQKMVSIFNGIDEIVDWRDEEVDKIVKMKLPEQQAHEKLEVVDSTFAEKFIDLYAYSSDMAQDSLYDFVALLLGIDDFKKEHMMALSVVTTFCEFIIQNSWFWKETENVFGY